MRIILCANACLFGHIEIKARRTYRLDFLCVGFLLHVRVGGTDVARLAHTFWLIHILKTVIDTFCLEIRLRIVFFLFVIARHRGQVSIWALVIVVP